MHQPTLYSINQDDNQITKIYNIDYPNSFIRIFKVQPPSPMTYLPIYWVSVAQLGETTRNECKSHFKNKWTGYLYHEPFNSLEEAITMAKQILLSINAKVIDQDLICFC